MRIVSIVHHFAPTVLIESDEIVDDRELALKSSVLADQRGECSGQLDANR